MDRVAPHLFRDIAEMAVAYNGTLNESWFYASTHALHHVFIPRDGRKAHQKMVWGAICGQLSLCRFSRHCGTTLGDLRRGTRETLWWSVEKGHIHILQFIKAWSDAVANNLETEPEPLAANPPCPLVDSARGLLTIRDIRFEKNFLLKRAAKRGNLEMFRFLKDWVDANGERLTLSDIRESKAVDVCLKYNHVDMLNFFKAEGYLTF